MTVHELKCWPDPFRAVRLRKKRHEWRRSDRGFRVGDEILLREFDPSRQHPGSGIFTGRKLRCRVTYISSGPEFEIPAGFVILSIELIGLK